MQEIRSSNPPVVTGFVIQINLEHDTITVKNSSPMAFPVGFLMFLHFSVLVRSWWFFMESICKSVLLMLGATLFLLYISDLPDLAICDTAIYADDTTLYFKIGLRICGFARVGFWAWIWQTRHYVLEKEVASNTN